MRTTFFTRSSGIVAAAALAVTLLHSSASARAIDEEGQQLQSVLSKQSACIVTVKATLKATMKGEAQGDSESPITMQGVVVTPDGLVMVSNLPFSPVRAMELLGRGTQEMAGYKVTPTAIKVMFAGDDKELDGFVAATDTNLDLAFIKIEGLGDRKLACVDFSTSVPAQVGQRVFAVSRLNKGYDYAAYVQGGRVIGEITKPRKAQMLEGSISGFGLPVFALSGEPIGVLTTVTAGTSDEASAAGTSFAMMMRFLTGGGGSTNGAFLLPGSSVKSVVDLASKRAADLAVERAKRKAEAPTTTAKPATGTAKPATGATKDPKKGDKP